MNKKKHIKGVKKLLIRAIETQIMALDTVNLRRDEYPESLCFVIAARIQAFQAVKAAMNGKLEPLDNFTPTVFR